MFHPKRNPYSSKNRFIGLKSDYSSKSRSILPKHDLFLSKTSSENRDYSPKGQTIWEWISEAIVSPKIWGKKFQVFLDCAKKNVRSFFGRIYGAPICFWFYRWLHKFILKLSNLQYSWLMLFYIFKRKATLDLQLLGNSGWLTESWDKFHFLCIFHPWGPNWLSGDARLFRAMWNQTHERCQYFFVNLTKRGLQLKSLFYASK